MASEAELVVREFAAQYQTANVARAVALAESGAVTWSQVEALCASALAAALEEVGA